METVKGEEETNQSFISNIRKFDKHDFGNEQIKDPLIPFRNEPDHLL